MLCRSSLVLEEKLQWYYYYYFFSLMMHTVQVLGPPTWFFFSLSLLNYQFIKKSLSCMTILIFPIYFLNVVVCEKSPTHRSLCSQKLHILFPLSFNGCLPNLLFLLCPLVLNYLYLSLRLCHNQKCHVGGRYLLLYTLQLYYIVFLLLPGNCPSRSNG